MPMAGSRPSRACIGWCASRPSIPMRAGTRASPRSRSIRRSTTRSRSTSTTRTCASTPIARRGQAASTSTPPTAPSASRICRRASSCTCQNERSQHKNRATAWAMLRARLYEAELKRREEEAQAAAAAKSDIGLGHQIRSYVLQPYQLVKDLRTGRRKHQSLSRARRRHRSVHRGGARRAHPRRREGLAAEVRGWPHSRGHPTFALLGGAGRQRASAAAEAGRLLRGPRVEARRLGVRTRLLRRAFLISASGSSERRDFPSK